MAARRARGPFREPYQRAHTVSMRIAPVPMTWGATNASRWLWRFPVGCPVRVGLDVPADKSRPLPPGPPTQPGGGTRFGYRFTEPKETPHRLRQCFKVTRPLDLEADDSPVRGPRASGMGSWLVGATERVCGGAGGGGPFSSLDGRGEGAGLPDKARRTRPGDHRGAAGRRRHRNGPGHGRSIQGPWSSPPLGDRGSVGRDPESTRRTPGRCLAGDLDAATPGTGPRLGRREVKRGRAEGCRVPRHGLGGFIRTHPDPSCKNETAPHRPDAACISHIRADRSVAP